MPETLANIMANETKEVDDFLAGLTNDGQADPLTQSTEDPFNQPNEEPKESKTEEGETEVKEEKVPFHKDPKIQRFIEREIAKRIPETKPVQETSIESDKLEAFATKIFGNDTPENKSKADEFKNILQDIYKEGARMAEEKVESRFQAETQADQEAEETLMQGFESIEETYGVDLQAPQNKKLKGQFIDYVEAIAPKDANGEMTDFPDMVGGFKIFQSLRQGTSQTPRAKELASRSGERGTSGDISKPQERLSWDSEVWERFKEQLH